MNPQTQKPVAWKGLNLAIVIAAGMLCLMASAVADANTSCKLRSCGVSPSNCHQTPDSQKMSPAARAPGAESDFAGTWAFILPGAHAFTNTHISAPSRLQAPAEPQLRSVFADIPIYQIAPKNSDPQLAILS